ncbi:MAG: serine hydrolase [Cytophagales bacterium]
MQKILTLSLCLVGLLIANFTSAQNNVQLSSFRSSLQGIIDNATTNYGMDGAALSVLLYDSIAPENFTSGVRSPGIPVDPNKPWHYAGLTGTYATYIVLKLIEEGSLTLDDSIGLHMDASAMNLDGSITVRELLRHTSPMVEYWNSSANTSCFNSIWNTQQSIVGCPEFILSCKEPDDPNKRGTYDNNNMNTITLGFLIDSVTGNSYKTEFQNRIFTPFGMSGTYLSGCDTVTCDSINGIYTTASGYQCPNRSYLRYFSTNGTNRGLISKPEEVVKFIRSFYRDELISTALMDSVKKVIPGSSLPAGPLSCVASINADAGYNTEIFQVLTTNGDSATFYGKSANGMNSSHSYHWVEKNITFSFAQNDRSRTQEFGLFFYDLACYLETIDSVIYPVLLQPVAGFSHFVTGSTMVNFTDTSLNNPTSWFWDFGDGNTDTVQNPIHDYISGGTNYSVTLITSNSVGSDTIIKVITLPTGLNKDISKPGSIYPNPSKDIVNLDLNFPGIVEISLMDIYGRVVDKFEFDNSISKTFKYTIPSQIKSGSYFIMAQSKSGKGIHRIQIQR